MTDRDRDYEDGHRHAYHGDAYDPARVRTPNYRDGTRARRAQRADEERRAVYGDDTEREATQ